MKKIIGYTQGAFDSLHYGHVRLLKNAKLQCDYLIVGVNSDALIEKYKNTKTIIKENERKEIVESIKYVDKVLVVNTLDKDYLYHLLHFDKIFIGDDWKGSKRWENTEKQLSKYGVPVVFLPHTDGISTTMIKEMSK